MPPNRSSGLLRNFFSFLRLFSGLQLCQNSFGGRGSALDPTGGAHDAPPDLLDPLLSAPDLLVRGGLKVGQGPCPQTMDKKIKTQLPRYRCAGSCYKTAHKYTCSSFAPFQAYDNTKVFSFRGIRPWQGALPLVGPASVIGSRSALASGHICHIPPISTRGSPLRLGKGTPVPMPQPPRFSRLRFFDPRAPPSVEIWCLPRWFRAGYGPASKVKPCYIFWSDNSEWKPGMRRFRYCNRSRG